MDAAERVALIRSRVRNLIIAKLAHPERYAGVDVLDGTPPELKPELEDLVWELERWHRETLAREEEL